MVSLPAPSQKTDEVKKPRKILGVRVAAIFEALFMLAFILAMSRLIGDTSRFIHVSPHPFWVPVLLISVQYGCIEGIITALLATIALYMGNVPIQQYQETLFDYQLRLAAQPFMWFVAAFILGEIRLRVDAQNRELVEEITTLSGEAAIIYKAYEQLKETKSQQDRLLASQSKTASAIYQTFQLLQGVSPTQILTDLPRVFSTALNPHKFSVFAMGHQGFEVATSHGWTETDQFMRRIPKDHPLFQAVGIDRRLVAVFNPDDEAALKGQGMLAAPLYDSDTQQLLGMVKVEAIDFLDFNRNTLEGFQALCNLVGLSYANARRYRALERQAIFSNLRPVYSLNYLSEQQVFIEELCKQAKIPLSSIHFQGHDERPQELLADDVLDEGVVAHLLVALVKPKGQVFKASRHAYDFIILLPNTDTIGAQSLAGEILEAVMKDERLKHLKLSQKVEVLVDVNVTPVQPARA